MEIVVVLPAPLPPSRPATVTPRGTAKLMASTAVTFVEPLGQSIDFNDRL